MKWIIAAVIIAGLNTSDLSADQLSEREIDRIREQKIAEYKAKKKAECQYWKEQNRKIMNRTTYSMVQKECYGREKNPTAHAKAVPPKCGEARENWQNEKNKENAYKLSKACFPNQVPREIKIGGENGREYYYKFTDQ